MHKDPGPDKLKAIFSRGARMGCGTFTRRCAKCGLEIDPWKETIEFYYHGPSTVKEWPIASLLTTFSIDAARRGLRDRDAKVKSMRCSFCQIMNTAQLANQILGLKLELETKRLTTIEMAAKFEEEKAGMVKQHQTTSSIAVHRYERAEKMLGQPQCGEESRETGVETRRTRKARRRGSN
ncbi:hypothetical protein K469DRAFT_690745 [Zopfia rhizophila CBS 207.26]|uniref:Uncharacterized protein n=1 Tax=Zopfia rhizophila CBS 207.26 TaxID=1314779 RepID=A0A6A6DSR7_9PEZI|nr:hypothetical protein K469DRAFT_690745 [Zopfia rhizophila CBS 207.26]